MIESLFTSVILGICGLVVYRVARDSRITWQFAAKKACAGGLIAFIGLALGLGAGWLLLCATDGHALDQALVLVLAVFLSAPLEGQRFMPQRPPYEWHPSLLFRVHEIALLMVIVVIAGWGILAPTSRSFG